MFKNNSKLSQQLFAANFFNKGQTFLVENNSNESEQQSTNQNSSTNNNNIAIDKDNITRVCERLKNLELMIKHKMKNNYTSVRRAFLQLDSDHDGIITVEDFIRVFSEVSNS